MAVEVAEEFIRECPHVVRALLNERPLPRYRLPFAILRRGTPFPRRHRLAVSPQTSEGSEPAWPAPLVVGIKLAALRQARLRRRNIV